MIDRPRRPLLALLTIVCVATLPACYNWHVPEAAPSRYIVEEQPDIVRLTLSDSSSLDIEDPTIIGASIVGVLGTSGRGRLMVDSTVSVPLDEVSRAEVRELSTTRTVVLISAVAGGIFVTLGRVFSNWVHR